MGLNIRLWLIKYELEKMSRYLDLTISAIGQQVESVEQKYHEAMAHELSEYELGSLDDQYTDDFFEVGLGFPQLLLTSFVIAWYSFVEQQLLELCGNLHLTITLRPSDNPNLGTGIRRSRKFLLDARKYTIHDEHWQELVRIGKLRNFLVHEGDRISWSYIKPQTSFVEHKVKWGGGVTVYIVMGADLFGYLKKHDMLEEGGVNLQIRPPFEYAQYLVEFGKELFSKLYADMYPKP
jgi:hypothetical protein